jgi:hypothetical protein
MAKRRGKDGRLSVYRIEDVPLKEVSGVCLRRGADGEMSLVAIGDRTAVVAWVVLPDEDAGAFHWQQAGLTDVHGTQLPLDDPQIEAICADGAGRVLLLQETPARVELVDWAGRRVVASIALRLPADHPLTASWTDPEGSRGEGAAFLRNGHLLIAKEKDPPAFIEFGPTGEAASGFRAGAALDKGDAWPVGDGDHVFDALATWMPDRELLEACADFSDLEVGPDGRLYLLSDKSQSLVRLAPLLPEGGRARADRVWKLPELDGKPEGLAITRNGRAIVALDTKRAGHNLVLLEPAIAAP